MEFVFDKAKWSHGPDAPRGDNAHVHPDWAGLRMRLFAAREARIALESSATNPAGRSRGSFDKGTARELAALSALKPLVNPNASANRKPERGINNPVATFGSTGDRDQI